jgi:carboxyl-terminal processing protease
VRKSLRFVTLAVLCGALGLAGYTVSVQRGGRVEPVNEVLAAAGSEPGFFSSETTESGDDYRISALTVFSNVALHVKDNYVNPERIDPKEMLLAALNEIERQVAEVLVEDMGQGKVRVRVMQHEKIVHIDDVESLWEINLKLREVFRFFEKHLPPQKDMRAIEYAAVNGALSTLDPHSVLLKPDAFQDMKTSTKGEFGGLGIVISQREGKLTIVSPLEGTPASRAGLLAGDIISRIGEVSTVSMPIEEAVNMLRGPEGSKVTIWVERKTWAEGKRFALTRERIKIESVEEQLLSDNVGYIKIKNFQQNTGKDLEEKLTKLQEQAGGKLKGLVLDLRNNPGGLLEQAIRVSDKFLTSGDIVTTVGYGNKLREPKKARWSGTESELPIAVLVNNGSASASEIVAGALRNLDRAVIIGERTFGKGSVQVLYDFADNSALKLTIAQYLTPGGISIQNVGVTPDIELKSAHLEEARVNLFYEPESHRENSLDKHLDRQSDVSTENVDEGSKMRLTYLVEKEAPQPEGDAEDDTPRGKFEEDFPMKLARELLIAAGAPSRLQTIKNGTAMLKQREAEEAKRIQEKITSLGLDWSEGQADAAGLQPKAEVELKLIGGTGDHVNAGGEVKVEATVKNTGTAPFYRLRATLDSEHPSFKGRELLFGRINPGESRSWTIATKFAKDMPSRSDFLKLRLETASGARSEEVVQTVVTKHVPHPQFGYTYVIDDSKKGDGDGILEAGEEVDLVVFVTNSGSGDADEVWLRLKSAAGEDLFLKRGRADIGKIKAGETKSARLKFSVRKNQTPGRDGLPVELTIADTGTSEWMEDQFSLVAEGKKQAMPGKARGGVTMKKDSMIYAAADAKSEIIGVASKGTKLSHSARIGELLRVDLEEETFGWVLAEDARMTGKPKGFPTAKQLVYQTKRRAPTIKLDTELGESVVESEGITLSGTINGRELRDMYVLLNDKKVFFASGPNSVGPGETTVTVEKPEGEKAVWTAPNESAAVLPFKVDLRLKEGSNRVLIVARLDEKVISYRTLYVSRRAARAAEVAEANRNVEKPGKTAVH